MSQLLNQKHPKLQYGKQRINLLKKNLSKDKRKEIFKKVCNNILFLILKNKKHQHLYIKKDNIMLLLFVQIIGSSLWLSKLKICWKIASKLLNFMLLMIFLTLLSVLLPNVYLSISMLLLSDLRQRLFKLLMLLNLYKTVNNLLSIKRMIKIWE